MARLRNVAAMRAEHTTLFCDEGAVCVRDVTSIVASSQPSYPKITQIDADGEKKSVSR